MNNLFNHPHHDALPKEWLDSSKVELLHMCPQKFYWRHELGLVPKVEGRRAGAMEFGFAVHKALEALYAGSITEPATCPCPSLEGCEYCGGKAIPKFLAQFLLFYPEDPIDEKDPRTRANGCRLLVEYVKKWREEERHYQILASEIPFMLDMGEFCYVGRIDQLCKWRSSGAIFPRDHKTASRFGDIFTGQFKLSGQMTGYMVATERVLSEGSDSTITVAEAEINAIRTGGKPTDECFLRIPTTRTPDEKQRWERDIRSAWEHIQHYRATDFWPRHAPFACSAYMRRCEYWSLCTSDQQTQELLMQTAYDREEWNPIDANG